MAVMNPSEAYIGRDFLRAEVEVWDPLVRIFHWSLVASYIVAWVSADEWDRLHEWVGYTVLGLVGFRIIWGVVGPRYARFAQFVRGPDTVTGYVKDVLAFRAKRYLGHNPAGGVMVIVLLVLLAVLSGTGYLLTTASFHDAGWVKEIHEAIANLTLGLVGFHVLGVIFASLQHGENLIRSMFTGRKPAK
jgi:cytochrome b